MNPLTSISGALVTGAVIALLMLVYLGISVGISALGNAYNRSITTRAER